MKSGGFFRFSRFFAFSTFPTELPLLLRTCARVRVCGVTYIIGGYLLECNTIPHTPYFWRCKLARLQVLYIRWLLR